MKKEFKIEFIESIQEFTNEELGAIVGGTALSINDCGCDCGFFIGKNCECHAATPKATFNSCPCECKTKDY